jgi:hypothetical protein
MPSDSAVRTFPYALRLVGRKGGRAAVVYRRQADEQGRDRLQRVGALAPLAYQAALPMLREAVRASANTENGAGAATLNGPSASGAFKPLDSVWGPRVACLTLACAGLRDGERMARAADHLRRLDGALAAWWLGRLLRGDDARPLRALRILIEAVQ